MLYDIINANRAKQTLNEVFGLSDELIKMICFDFISSEVGEDKIFEYIKNGEISFEKMNLEEIYLVTYHVTSLINGIDTLEKNGLVNLQQSLILDTDVKKFLNQNGVDINVKKSKMYFDGKEYDINYNKLRKAHNGKEQQWLLSRKIYFDHQINGFFFNKDFISYSGRVHERPDFLNELDKLLNINLSDKWESMSSPYVIIFACTYNDFEKYTFSEEIYKFKHKKDNICFWLLISALYIATNSSDREIYAFLSPDKNIEYTDLKIEALETK